MQQLFPFFLQRLKYVTKDFIRYLYTEIQWHNRLIAIIGARGTGKTTMLLQYIKENYEPSSGEVLYVSLDHFWFTVHHLTELADEFVKNGGKALFLDEVHKYAGWSTEIKTIYDTYPELKIVFTGSSLLEVYRGEADLSRRLVVYYLPGLSFREFLEYEYGLKYASVTLSDVLKRQGEITTEIVGRIKPLVAFKKYIKYGYFPYYKEDGELYHQRILSTLDTVIESDLPAVERIDYYSVVKMKKLFMIMSSLVPFTPNVTQLSRDMAITRISLMNYLYYLDKAQAIMLLEKEALGIKQMTKPEKIYLGNTNYAYALGGDKTDIGSVRETFFLNQLRVRHKVSFAGTVDFKVNDEFYFEVGGVNKTQKQIKGREQAYLVLDDLEQGWGNKIPLWIFGLLY